ncbi:facilitated trehalose transporter Tret1-like, partial [Aphis craccivora]
KKIKSLFAELNPDLVALVNELPLDYDNGTSNAISIQLDLTKMTFGNSFPKVGTWLESSAHWFVRWFLKIVSIFLPNNKPALTANDTTAAGGIALPAIRQEVKKFIQYIPRSWVESLIAIGAIFVTIPTGKCAEIFGQKNVIVCLTISFVFSWITIYLANDVWMVFVARLITG